MVHMFIKSNDKIKDYFGITKNMRVLELGSGTGVLGLTFAIQNPDCQVYLSDLEEAKPIIENNISLNS